MHRNKKEQLNIRFKFKDAINQDDGDTILFRVFDILLGSAEAEEKGSDNEGTDTTTK